MTRKVCIFTGTRAEYGLLNPLMKNIQASSELELLIIVSGTHLSQEFGMTCEEIEKDGFKVNEKVDIHLDEDTPEGVCKSMGMGMTGYSKALKRLKPDILVLLGDRYEAFAMAAAATVCKVPIAHIHGGETTQGAIDEAFRHSITKMSHLHFTSTEEHKSRVIQLGEQPTNVYNVGSLGTENIHKLDLLEKNEIAKQIGFNLENRYLLVTYLPVTLEAETSEEQFASLLSAIDTLDDIHVIFTKANADPDGRKINRMIDLYVKRSSKKAISFTSMGQLRYLSAMKYAEAVVGNSSSGIIEAPSLNVPTVNIGDRQQGRVKALSIIDCKSDLENIVEAINLALSDTFKIKCKNIKNPYEGNNTSSQILLKLKTTDLNDILKKEFLNLTLPKNITPTKPCP